MSYAKYWEDINDANDEAWNEGGLMTKKREAEEWLQMHYPDPTKEFETYHSNEKTGNSIRVSGF